MLLALLPLLVAVPPQEPESEGWLWRDARTLTVEGQGWSETAAPWDRLPAEAEARVRPAVWKLARDSAGIAVRFTSDASELRARWSLTDGELAMPHMPASGVSGLDLYARHDGRLRWLGATRPGARENEAVLARGLAPGAREYVLYLPLYNGVSALSIGVPDGARLSPATPRLALPVVFYGTSITQGACASRPGMTHVAILGRWLERPVVNLGFSGNGRLEPELADLLGELEAAVYVVDCLPNLRDPELVTERLDPFVARLRAARPDIPILLVEDRTWQNAFLRPAEAELQARRRAALRAAHAALVASGVDGLAYLPGAELLGDDGEASVDASHPSDLGFERQARAFLPILRELLGK